LGVENISKMPRKNSRGSMVGFQDDKLQEHLSQLKSQEKLLTKNAMFLVNNPEDVSASRPSLRIIEYVFCIAIMLKQSLCNNSQPILISSTPLLMEQADK